MADTDPTDIGPAVRLSVPIAEAESRRRRTNEFETDLDDDLKALPDDPPAGGSGAKADAYGRLVAGLEGVSKRPERSVNPSA